MIILKFVTIILNVILALMVGYFLSCQSWANEDDRPSIIGFAVMIAVYMLDIALLMIG